MIDAETKEHVTRAFTALREEVVIDLYTKKKSPIILPGASAEDSESAQAAEITEQLLTELSALSPKLSLKIHDATADPEPAKKAGVAEYVPAIVFHSAQTKGTLRYLGVPAGYEFKTLIDTILALGLNEHGLSEESQKELGRVSTPVNVKVYVTPG